MIGERPGVDRVVLGGGRPPLGPPGTNTATHERNRQTQGGGGARAGACREGTARPTDILHKVRWKVNWTSCEQSKDKDKMAALLVTAALLSSIYPDGHFQSVTKLTASNIDATIKSNIDAGKTLFVRFIASEG
jgi:hypothetical protein